ncbi:ABC transporter permease [Inquilinus limosus]|uniref:ABC transporter permease n=1 Tax=Inquilinus limosus TaxID=171674 RepID=UPI00042A85D7|nr:ABC transporter permease [Inquilinus limosus]
MTTLQTDTRMPQGRAPAPRPAGDERLRSVSLASRLLSRPELGAMAGTVLVFVFFAIAAGGSGMFSADGVSNWLVVSAQLGILAVGASLLMIAGEFDLSIGSMIGFAGMMIAIPTVFFGWPVWLSLAFAFAGALAIGALNGWLVVRTGLPSFIVSLAFLFILRGMTIALSILFTNRTIVGGLKDPAASDWLAPLFYGTVLDGLYRWAGSLGWIATFPDGTPVVPGLPVLVVWWVALTAIGAWILLRTRFGNWIFAVGGDNTAARNMGVPVGRVKVLLFMGTAFCSTVFAACQVMEFGSAAADRGLLKEFEAIIAAVIGGTLLTGGYGSVIGAAFGALIFGVVQMGIFYSGVNTDWFKVFLGVMLLLAVMVNNYIRRKVTGGRS